MRHTVAKVYGQLMRFDRPVRRDIRAHAWDYALAGVMVAIALVALITRIDVEDTDAHLFHPDTWWGWVATTATCAILIGRRRWPLQTLTAGLILVLPLEFARQRDPVAFFALVITLYSVAAYLPPRVAVRGLALMAVFYAVLAVTDSIVLSAVPVLGALFLTAAFALGLIIQLSRTRQRRDAQAAIERAVAAIETTELDAAGERLRMAQELHDVVAHSLSVIAVQAGIGAHLVGRQPVEASRALDAIRSTCATTERELGRLVGILRNGTTTDSTAAPTIADIAALVGQIRTADLPVNLIVDGDLTAVPAGASLAAYRIVQEALTNVVRHAGTGAAATVKIQATIDGISLAIDDNGHGPAPHETVARIGGNGLLGMSERARMYGGDVQSGPRPGGGFRVRATLGCHADAPTSGNPPRALVPIADDPKPDRRRFSSATWDAALAVLMVVVATLEVITADPAAAGPHFTPTHLWAFSLRTASCATLAFRRRHPTVAYAAAWMLGLALTIGDYQVGVMIFVLWIGLYSIAAYATRRQLVGAVIATIIGIAVIAWSRPPDLTGAGAVWAGAFFAASAIAGFTVRCERDRRTTELDTRQDASAAHVRRAQLLLTSERLRIADELGAVITRSIDTIAHLAEAGTPLVATDTAAARDTLQTISAISRDALNDLRRLLKHMRTTTAPTIYAPIPALISRSSPTRSASCDDRSDPSRCRRRPSPRPQRFPRPTPRRRRHRRRRRSSQRLRSRQARQTRTTRRDPDGHPHAGNGRARSHPADHRRPDPYRGTHPHPHHLRPRRLRPRSPTCRSIGLFTQRHPSNRTPRRRTNRRCGRSTLGPEHHPPPHRRLHPSTDRSDPGPPPRTADDTRTRSTRSRR
jgi:signal transduction histidine kinase